MKFYETVFEVTLERNALGPLEMAWFPMAPDSYGSAGSLVKHDAYKPSTDGVLVYFTAKSGDVATELARVEAAGGKVLQGKKEIGEHGFIGLMLDTEGNRIGIHSRK